MSSDEKTGLKNWLLTNDVKNMEMDEIFRVDEEQHNALLESKPWLKDPEYFKHVKISAVALLKMVMHACAGGTLEIMGMMLGRVVGDTIVVLDSYSLPVVGTETRVNPGAEADAFMVAYDSTNEALGRLEKQCGWYHSHPGYGCWLSGIDVSTQELQQQLGPMIAVVVDPTRTISAGRVEIGAFRTYPKDYKPPLEAGRQLQSVPLAKVEDFGAHAHRYYTMDVTYFKSSLDAKILELLWHKYWISTLSSSPLVTNKDYTIGQIRDMSEKFLQVDPDYLANSSNSSLYSDKKETALSRTARECAKISREQMHNLIAMTMKQCLFNCITPVGADAAAASADRNETQKGESSVEGLSDTVSLASAIEKQQLKKTA